MSHSQYVRYRNWLIETDTRESQVSFEEWLAGTFPDDVAQQKQHIVAAVVSGEIPKAGFAGNVLNEAVLNAGDDLKAALAAMARTRIGRINRTILMADRVESLLMERIDLQTASMDQLLMFAQYLRRSAGDDMKLVMHATDSPSKSGLEGAQFNVNIGDQILVGDSPMRGRDTRDRVRAVVDQFLRVIERHEPTTGSTRSKPLEAGPEDTGG